jgi:hypothetical protein
VPIHRRQASGGGVVKLASVAEVENQLSAFLKATVAL